MEDKKKIPESKKFKDYLDEDIDEHGVTHSDPEDEYGE